MPGTFSSGISTPRSPRATMIASVTSMISSSRCTAAGFSILAITAARPRQIFFASAMSSGRWMNDSPIQSMPASSAASRSERSFGRQRRERDQGVGQADALAVGQLAADLDAGDDFLAARLGDDQADLAVVEQQAVAGLEPAKISGCGSCTRIDVARRGVAGRTRRSRRCRASPARWRRRRRAASVLADRPGCRSGDACCFSTARIVATSSRMRSCEEWLMLMRNDVGAGLEQLADHLRVAGGGAERGDDLGAAQASHRRAGIPGSCDGPAVRAWAAGRRACSGRCGLVSPASVSCTVQARCSPVSTSKKPVRSIAARQAILGAADGELFFAGAHEGLARPFAAAVVVDGVDVIVARDKCPLSRVSQLRADRFHQPSVVQLPSASL